MMIKKIFLYFKIRITEIHNKLLRIIILNNIITLNNLSCTKFEYFKNIICKAGTDSLRVFGQEYTHEGGLYLQQNPNEFAALLCLLQSEAVTGNYLEIGSGSGGTCNLLNQYLQFNRVYIIDNGLHKRAPEQTKNFKDIHSMKIFIGDSHSKDAEVFLNSNLTESIDIAFIDGDHSYAGVKKDLDLVLKFSKPGTIIIFHDTKFCRGVESVWLSFIRSKRGKPVAEFIDDFNPKGIAVGKVIC